MNVQKLVKSITCTRKYLTKVRKMEIIRLKYCVWINCKKYEEKVTWILIHMNFYKKKNDSTRWVDFEFCINGVPICSICYAHALGYSPQ